MVSFAPSSAIRRSASGAVKTALALTLVACAMVAPRTLDASDVTVHEASRTPRFGNRRTVTLSVGIKKRIVAPNHAAPAELLPVVRQKDITAHHQELADSVLRSLPSFCRENLKNFYVNYDANAKNRGLGGENTIIIIGTVPDDEFRALIVHECGHVTDIGGLRGTSASGPSGFLDGNATVYKNDPSVAFYQISWVKNDVYRPGAKETDFVSGYATSDPFEDFGETFAFYALQKTEFERLARTNSVLRAKYEFMRDVVFRETPSIADGNFVRGNHVPWDVTKLPFAWK